jgi:hypothetical protein
LRRAGILNTVHKINVVRSVCGGIPRAARHEKMLFLM